MYKNKNHPLKNSRKTYIFYHTLIISITNKSNSQSYSVTTTKEKSPRISDDCVYLNENPVSSLLMHRCVSLANHILLMAVCSEQPKSDVFLNQPHIPSEWWSISQYLSRVAAFLRAIDHRNSLSTAMVIYWRFVLLVRILGLISC